MTPEQILDRLDRLLEEERAAIRRLDGPFVDGAAVEKTALVAALRAQDLDARADLAPRVEQLVWDLRRNAVLLAHARDCLQDLLSAAQGVALEGAARTSLGPATAPSVGLSLRG